MRREQAKSRTRQAQLAAGAMLMAAVAVAAVPASLLSGEDKPAAPAPGAAVPAAPTAASKPTGAVTAALPAEPTDLASALDKISPPPPITPKAPVAEAPTDAARPVAEVAPPPWRYIGVIMGEARASHRAFVSVNEKQRLVAEGDKIDGDHVDEIHDRYLLVTGASGEQRRVEIGVPERVKITSLTPGSAGTTALAAAAGSEAPAVDPSELDQKEMEIVKSAMERGAFAAYVDPSMSNVPMRSPEDIAAMVVAGQIRPGKFGGTTGIGPIDPSRDGFGVNELDTLRQLNRFRMQRLDEDFHSGKVDINEFRRRAEELDRQTPTEDDVNSAGKTQGVQPAPAAGAGPK